MQCLNVRLPVDPNAPFERPLTALTTELTYNETSETGASIVQLPAT